MDQTPSSPRRNSNVFDMDATSRYQAVRAPSLKSRRTVPYVNEKREFDPDYDPRDITIQNELLQQQGSLHGTSEKQGYKNNDTEEIISFEDRRYRDRCHRVMRRSLFSNRVSTFFSQTTDPQYPSSTYNSNSTTKDAFKGAIFHQGDSASRLLDRPFDEHSSSRHGSSTGTDSLDEVLQQNSYTTSDDSTTGETEPVHIAFSAAEENPFLEAGSLSYSLTRANASCSVTSLGDPVLCLMTSPESIPSYDTLEQRDEPEIANSQGRKQSASQTFYYTYEKNTRPKLQNTIGKMDIAEPERRNEHCARSPSRREVSVSSVHSQSSITSSSDDELLSTDPSAAKNKRTPPDIVVDGKQSDGPTGDLQEEIEVDHTKLNLGRDDILHLDHKHPQSFSTDGHAFGVGAELNLSLHDLCGEAKSTDDIAWRNALYLLSSKPRLAYETDSGGWTPLHVACMGPTPAPLFVIRALISVNERAVRETDEGGRLPLHLAAASSGDTQTMQLLIEEYPRGVYQSDCQGWTPLHLLLKNFSVDVTIERCSILLGLTIPCREQEQSSRRLQRRGDHLELPVEKLGELLKKKTPISRLTEREETSDDIFHTCRVDIQASLRRISLWKRKQRYQQENPEKFADGRHKGNPALFMNSKTNPAAYATSNKRQLPIHVLVRRGLIETNVCGDARHDNDDFDDTCDGGGDKERSPLRPTKFLELIRLFTAVYPEGLVERDTNGYTPLMTALLMTGAQISIELTQCLLGQKTSVFQHLSNWAASMPLYKLTADPGRYFNPAMVPTIKTQQLPLHVMAEDAGDNFPMLHAVYESYPGAIEIQDSRGRTPLHTLLRNYRRIPLYPRVIAILLSDKAAQTFDDDGKLPFDLLLEGASYLPQHVGGPSDKGANVEPYSTLKILFQGAITAASTDSNVRYHFEPCSFLWRLKLLPPWIRRQACSTSFIQELLIEELAGPVKCACILLYAALLVIFIVFFRKQVQNYSDSPEQLFSSSQTSLAVYMSAVGLMLFQFGSWSLCMSMSEFIHQYALNIWRWVDFTAVVLATTTTLLINHSSVSNEVVLIIATVATGLLWLSVVGFLSSWWYGAAIFAASIERVIRIAFWPSVVASIFVISFAEMFHTIAHKYCGIGLDNTSLCSVRGSYRLVYFLAVGEPIVDIGTEDIPISVSVLAITFLALLLLLILSALTMTFLANPKWDLEGMAVRSFWEPKLSSIIFTSKPKPTSRRKATLVKAESVWTVAMQILSGHTEAKGTYWYACFTQKAPLVKLCFWLVTAMIVPLWLILGAVTLGVLWPPQIRRYLFRPCIDHYDKPYCVTPLAETCTQQISSVRDELVKVRDMSYERSTVIQNDIKELKGMLYQTMRGE